MFAFIGYTLVLAGGCLIGYLANEFAKSEIISIVTKVKTSINKK